MSIHKEIRLEDEICADLTAAGWLYDAADAGRYDRTQSALRNSFNHHQHG